MKKLFLLIIFLGFLMPGLFAQTEQHAALARNAAFKGAKATGKKYRAIYQLDSGDPAIIEKTIRNINNVLADPRLAGKLHIELIAFSGGTDAYLKTGKYEDAIKALAKKGVIIAQCNNTLHERNISRDRLFGFIAIVPTGNGELILRQAEGWAIVKP